MLLKRHIECQYEASPDIDGLHPEAIARRAGQLLRVRKVPSLRDNHREDCEDSGSTRIDRITAREAYRSGLQLSCFSQSNLLRQPLQLSS